MNDLACELDVHDVPRCGPVTLGFGRRRGEDWRDVVRRKGAENGLQEEVLSYFDAAVATGSPEEEAAWCALYEWDCLDLIEEAAS